MNVPIVISIVLFTYFFFFMLYAFYIYPPVMASITLVPLSIYYFTYEYFTRLEKETSNFEK